MRVLLLANLRSGLGRAPRLGRALERDLTARGHEVILRDACAAVHGVPEGEGIADADVVVSIGGDGTIYHALSDLITSQRPVYHVPGGNENLFAREFGMVTDPGTLARAIEAQRVEAVDVGTVNGRSFAVMISIGPDAGVIHRLSQSRGRASGHAMYLRPVLREGVRPHLARLSLRVDGRDVVRGRPGLLVVGNSRQYAGRLDPARRADMRDGLLDVVFLPARSTAGVLWWGLRCALGDPLHARGVIYERGAEVVIESGAAAPWQADGEVGGWITPGQPLVVRVSPAALRVLCP